MAPGLIGGGGDDATLTRLCADHNGTSLVFRVFLLLDAGEERIQVHVGDPAVCLLFASHA